MPRMTWITTVAGIMAIIGVSHAQQATGDPIDLTVTTIGTAPVVTELITTEKIATKTLSSPEGDVSDAADASSIVIAAAQDVTTEAAAIDPAQAEIANSDAGSAIEELPAATDVTEAPTTASAGAEAASEELSEPAVVADAAADVYPTADNPAKLDIAVIADSSDREYQLPKSSMSLALTRVGRAWETLPDDIGAPASEADKLGQTIDALLADKRFQGSLGGKAIRDAISNYYASQDFQPIWSDRFGLNEAGIKLAERIAAATYDGLNPDDYPVPSASTVPITIEDAAKLDLALTRSALMFARHLQSGRTKPRAISPNLDQTPTETPFGVIIKALASSDNAAVVIDSYQPPHKAYKALKAKLAEVMDLEEEVIPVKIPTGKLMRLGSSDKRVPLLRERLEIAGETEKPNLFDEDVKAAVIAFQTENDLKPDGIVGNQTLAKMNGKKVKKLPAIVANMERWRWMKRDLGSYNVLVNIPEYRVRINRGERTVHTTRVIVGKPKHKTPVFSDHMEHVVVNPYWHVPKSISTAEMLPKLRANPNYLAARGYEVIAPNGRRINSRLIDWNVVRGKFPFHVQQPPGRSNALGQVKFLFPNKHSVYLHDTPTKSLFQRDYRAYSHGCVRILKPLEFADALLNNEPQLSGQMVRSLLGSKEQWLNLEGRIDVHLVYFTSWVDAEGELQFAADIYGYDDRVLAAMKADV